MPCKSQSTALVTALVIHGYRLFRTIATFFALNMPVLLQPISAGEHLVLLFSKNCKNQIHDLVIYLHETLKTWFCPDICKRISIVSVLPS